MMNQDKTFFLSDEPKTNLREDDSFGHLYYAQALYEILENTKAEHPYVIGLFGKWGVGKTSIINELKNIINRKKDKKPKHAYQCVVLDAWEYSENNFRREFLLDLGQRYEYKKEIKDRLTTKRVIESKEAPKYDSSFFVTLIKQLIALGLIFVVIYFAIGFISNNLPVLEEVSPFQNKLISAVITIILGPIMALSDNIKQLFTFHTTIQETEPAVHPDQFKELFSEIINEKAKLKGDQDRLIIVIDNLDRVKEAVVIQILGAIKTFLKEPKCIFILPCDDKGLKEHIIHMHSHEEQESGMTELQAAEYLRKFFQTTLTVRDFLEEDLDNFTDDVLSQMKIFEFPLVDVEKLAGDKKVKELKNRNKNEVSLVFRVALAKNPRRIVQLANKLTANYLLAVERGKEDKDFLRTVLENYGFLAKITVIGENWPSFYNLVSRRPNILRQLRTHFVSGEEKLPKGVVDLYDEKIKKEWDAGLENFLRRTKSIHTKFVSNFVKFKQKLSVTQIADYYAFHDAALSNDIDTVRKIIEYEETETDAAFDELIRLLHSEVSDHDVPSVTSLVNCMVHTYDLISGEGEGYRQKVADEVTLAINKKSYSNVPIEAGVGRFFDLLQLTRKHRFRNHLIFNIFDLIDFENNRVATFQIIETIPPHINIISAENQKLLKSKMQDVKLDEEEILEKIRTFANECRSSNQSFTESVLPQSFFNKNISMMSSATEPGKKALNFIKPFVAYLNSGNKNHLAGIVENHLADGLSQTNLNSRNTFGLECVETVGVDMFQGIESTEIVKNLASLYTKTNNQKQKLRVTNAYLKILPVLDETEQQIYHPRLIDLAGAAPADYLIKLADTFKDLHQETFSFDEILHQITQSSIRFANNRDLRKSLFKLADDAEARVCIERYTSELWRGNKQGFEALNDAKDYLRATEFRGLVEKLIEKSDGLSTNELEDSFKALAEHSDRYTKKFSKDLTEEILNDWMKKPYVESRRAGIILWGSIRNKDRDLQEKFYNRLVEYCQAPINDNTIVKPENKIYIDTLVDDLVYLSRDLRNTTIDLCLRLRETGKPKNIKILGYTLLAKLHADERAKEVVPAELIDDLENADSNDNDETVAIINTLEKYKEYYGDLTDRLRAAIDEMPSGVISDEQINKMLDENEPD